MPLNMIWCQCGVTAFSVAKLIVSALYMGSEKTPPSVCSQSSDRVLTDELNVQPVIIAMKKSMPARFPKKEINQILRTSKMLTRRCRKAVVMNLEMLSIEALEEYRCRYHNVTGE